MRHLHDTIRGMLENYNDLNSGRIDELYEEPSALEFMRYVAANRPFVVRRGAAKWDAVRKWNSRYLTTVLGDVKVNVAVTPHGNADSVIEAFNGLRCFVKPYERLEPFQSVLSHIQAEDRHARTSLSRERLVKYCQTQNDNLRGEYSKLFDDVPQDISFARIALQRRPDAINFWLGSSQSVTALHKDNYENIYVQVRGKKHFVLLPPVAVLGVNEQMLPSATYRPYQDVTDVEFNSDTTNTCSEPTGLQPSLDQPAANVPVAVWDPDELKHGTVYSSLLRPLRVTLEESDMLYLPACWFHKVSQSSGEENFACAVNYWYDMNFDGSFWTTQVFVRELAQQVAASDYVSLP